MSETRPTVFIGSSAEGHSIAEAIQLNLDHTCDATIWSQGVFGLGDGTLETLVGRKDDFDFAILVLTPDDLALSRDELKPSPRDNVMLELGIFLGAIGRKRTFAIYDRTANVKLPSDLAGVTHATFQPHADGNLQATLGAATTLIKGSIQQLGKRREKITADVDQHTQFQIIHDLLDNGAEQFIIWMHENNRPLLRQSSIGMGIRHEFWLRSLAGGIGMFSVDDFCRKLPDAGLLAQDLRNHVSLTERGHAFAKWLIENGHKAIFFESQVGGWGERPGGIPSWPPRQSTELTDETSEESRDDAGANNNAS